MLLSLVRIFDSPLFVVFPAELLSIPPLSSLEALYFFYKGRLPGGGRPAVDPSAYLSGAGCTPLGVCAVHLPAGGLRFSGPIRRGFCLTVMCHQAHATWPDEPEQRVLPAPATVFGIVTPPPFVRIATAPTGIPSPVYWARNYVLSPTRA